MLRKRTKPRVRDKAKAAGSRSRVRKGPARDEKHLAKVREMYCLICHGLGMFPWINRGKSEAHHVRCIGPRTMGVRVSDHLTVPLCKLHHARLHEGNEGAFWKYHLAKPIDPAAWISAFSEEGRQAIAELRKDV